MKPAIPGIDEVMDRDYRCECGQTHQVRTRRIVLENGLAPLLPGHMRELGLPENILLIADSNTWAAAGADTAAALADSGMRVTTHVIPGEHVHAEERTVGSVLLAAEPPPGILVAVGSGSINDLGRFCATRMKIPYLSVATAASMDGYASTVTPLMWGGMKITFPGVHPEIVAADPAVLAAAPQAMMAAGLGDIVGKHSARLDWLLANAATDEEFCPVTTGMMEKALRDCVAIAPELGKASPAAARSLMEALTLAGLAMQMQGNSRPASGSEHHISHFLDMRDAQRGKPPSLHGDKVGAASLVVLRMYEKFFAAGPPPQGPMPEEASEEREIRRVYGPAIETLLARRKGSDQASRDSQWARLLSRWDGFRRQAEALPQARKEYAQALRAAGGPVTLEELGYGRDEVRDALLYAREFRPRYTLLTLLANRGRLNAVTEEILDELYQ